MKNGKTPQQKATNPLAGWTEADVDHDLHFAEVQALKHKAEQLTEKWIKDERQYRSQVKEAREKGSTWQAKLAHADQLSECRRALQEAFGLVMHPDDVAAIVCKQCGHMPCVCGKGTQ